MQKILLFIIITTSILACTSHKEIYKETYGGLDQLDSVNITGVYLNKVSGQIDSKNTRRISNHEDHTFLWDKLYKGFLSHTKTPNYSENSTVIIKRLNKRTLTATLVNNGDTVQTVKLKGRNKENYFLVNRKILLVPIPILFYLHKEKRILIGRNKSEKLIIKEGQYVYAWMGFHGQNQWLSEYRYQEKHFITPK